MDKDIDKLIIDEAQKAIVRRLTPEKIAEVKELHNEMILEFNTQMDLIGSTLENKPSSVLVDASIIAVKEFKKQVNKPQALGDIALAAVAVSEDFLCEGMIDAIVNGDLEGVFTDFENIDRCASFGMTAEEIAYREELVVEDVEEYLEKSK